jgi:hypothetical protein
MELKDVILSTLAEMETDESSKQASGFEVKETIKPTIKKRDNKPQEEPKEDTEVEKSHERGSELESELKYLNSIRERLLVLFEGFQAPNNKNIEAKVDMTLNFLEYVLATIDNRVESLKKRENR